MAVGEFDLIRKYFQTPSRSRDVLLGIGDDCALVPGPGDRQLAITTDTLVAGVHFPGDTSPADIAHKAIAVNLSDLAAMGAEPAWLTLALTLPEPDESWLGAFAESFRAGADRYRVQLIGGDTTRGALTITVQAMGLVEPGRAMRRDAARPGDAIYVSGTLGDAATGLKIRQQQVMNDDQNWLLNRLNRPEPRVELGLQVSSFCRCCIDISDGLAADLGHILEASRCGATVNIDRLPLSRQLVAHSGGRNNVDRDEVLAGGDDYELCLVLDPNCQDRLMTISSELSLPLTRIGVIESGDSLTFVDDTGARFLPSRNGYEHFAT